MWDCEGDEVDDRERSRKRKTRRRGRTANGGGAEEQEETRTEEAGRAQEGGEGVEGWGVEQKQEEAVLSLDRLLLEKVPLL